MTKRSPALLAAALLCLAAPLPAHGQSARLPEGAGQEVVQEVCTGCHGISQIQNSSGYTREGWEELISTMIDLSDSPELETITEYLATHFPESSDRAPKLVPGDASIRFTQWKAPTLGQRSRDPVQAPMAQSGGPASGPTSLDGWTPGPARSGNSHCRRARSRTR